MTISLAVTARDESTKAEVLRTEGGVPAVVYGPKQEPVQITVSAKEFDKIRKEAGESTIIELSGLKEAVEVLIKEVEFNPVKQQVMHIDFYAIERGKDMTTTVALHYIGEAPVEEANLGTLNKVLHEVTVTCRPSVLPSHIDVDVSSMTTIEDKIQISDLVVSDGVEIDAEPTDPVVVVSPARAQEVEEESSEVDMDEIEVEQKGKEVTEGE